MTWARSHDALGFSVRAGQAAVALLICFFMVWDIRAVATDQAPLPTDSTLEPASLLHNVLRSDEVDFEGLRRWISDEKKGPLTSALALLGGALAGDPLVGARLPGVLVHGSTLALVAALAVRLTGGWSAAVLAVALAGVTPSSFAWHRMDVHDALLSAPLILILWLVTWPPRRAAGAAALGLFVSLAMLLKVGGVVFLIGPGAVYILDRLSRRKERGRLLITAASATVILLPWVIFAAETLLKYMGLSSHDKTGLPLNQRLNHYAFFPPLGWAYLCGAPAAWVVLRRWSQISRRFLLMGGLMVGGGATLLVLAFDPIVRYMAPIYPVMALLMALALRVGLVRLARRWRPALSRAAVGVACAALLLPYAVANLYSSDDMIRERSVESGMLSPEQRRYNGLQRLIARMKRKGERSLNLAEAQIVGSCPVSAQFIWQVRGFTVPWLDRARGQQWLKQGGPVYLLVCHGREVNPLDDLGALAGFPAGGEDRPAVRLGRRVLKAKFKVVAREEDPSGTTYSLLKSNGGPKSSFDPPR